MQRLSTSVFQRRSGAVAALVALWSLGTLLADATGQQGWWPSLLGWLDVATPLTIVLGTAALAVAWNDGGGSSARWRSATLPLVWRTYLVWWTALAVSIAAGNTIVSPERSAFHALVFRHPGSAGPPPDLAIGAALNVLLVVAVVLPVWRRVVDRVAARTGRSDSDAQRLVAAALFVVGVVLALVVRSVDDAEFGLASHVLGRLHLVALGLALATTRGTIRGAGATPNRRRTRQSVEVAAFLGPACLVLVGPALGLVARQYRERIVLRPDGWSLDGSMLAPAIWTVCLTVALALCVRVLGESSVAGLLREPSRRPLGWGMWLAAVTAGGFVWRVITLLVVAPERTDGGDPLFYHATANIIAQGRGFPEPLNWIAFGKSIPSALHGPLYPVYLSIWSRLGATTYFDQKMASILVGTGTVLIAGLLGRRIGGRGVGLAAAVLAALYPHLWLIDGVMFPEGLMVLLCGLSMLAAYRWRDTHSLGSAVALGATIGLAALTRGEGLFLALVLAVPWMLRDRSIAFARRFRDLTIAGVACVVVLAPWMLHNLPRFEVFVPLSTNGNELHVYSNCDDVYSGKFLGYWSFACQERLRAESGEPEGDEAEKAVYWRDIGFEYARDHADQLPKVVVARVARQWDVFAPLDNAQFAAIEGRSVGAAQAGLAMYWAMVPLAIWGTVRVRRRGVAVLPLLAQAVMVTMTAAYAYGNTRFRAPAELSLCVLAAAGLTPVVSRVWRRVAPTGARHAMGGSDAFVLGRRRERTTAGRRRSLVAVGIVAATIVAPLRGLYIAIGSTMEEGFMLVFPERVMKGDVPNVDFLHLYGPGSLDVLAAVYSVFGTSLGVERTVGLVQHLGIITAIWALTRIHGRAVATIASVVCALLVLTPIGLTALAWNGGVALGLWSLVIALRARRAVRPGRWWVFAGVLAGLSLSYRPDLAVAITLGVGWALWTDRARWKPALIGAVAGLVPMWVHLVVAGPTASIQGMLLDPVRELRPGRELPRPPSWYRVEGALQVIGENVAPWWQVPSLSASQQLFIWFWTLPLVAVALVVSAGLAHRRRHGPRTRVMVGAALFGLGMLPQAFQRPDSAHLAWVSMVVFPLAVGAVADLIARRRAEWTPAGRVALLTAGSLAVLAVVCPFYSYRPYLFHVRQSLGDAPAGLVVSRDERSFRIGDDRTWRAAQAAVDDLDRWSQPGQRLLVGPVDLRQTVYSDVFFHHLFPELDPATYYIEMDPGLANTQGSSLPDDVRSADWLLLTRFWSGWIEPNTSIVFGPDDANVVVEQEFCLRGSYERDLVRIYERCEGGGAPGPYEGPYDPTVDYAVEVNVPVPPRSDGTRPPVSVD